MVRANDQSWKKHEFCPVGHGGIASILYFEFTLLFTANEYIVRQIINAILEHKK